MKNGRLLVFFCRHAAVCLFFLLFLGACVAGGGVSSGGLRTSMEVEGLFRSATILPDHSYYIQGTAANPQAIIGLKNSFQLRSRLWSRVDWTEKELKDTVFWMQLEEAGFCTTESGYLVLPGGQRIGVWYSQRDWAVIRQPEAGVVEIYPFDFTLGSPCYRRYQLDKL